MKKEIYIGDIASYIEKLQYEKDSLIYILRYLLKSGDYKEDYIKDYEEKIFEKTSELEIAKRECAEEFKPYNKIFDFIIDFYYQTITYIYPEGYNEE